MLRVENSQIVNAFRPQEKGRLVAKAIGWSLGLKKARTFGFFAVRRPFSAADLSGDERSRAMNVLTSPMRDVHFEQDVEQIERAFLQVGEQLSFSLWQVVKDCAVAVFVAFATPEQNVVKQALRGIAI